MAKALPRFCLFLLYLHYITKKAFCQVLFENNSNKRANFVERVFFSCPETRKRKTSAAAGGAEWSNRRRGSRAGQGGASGGAERARLCADAAPLNFTGWGAAAVTKTEQTFCKENPGFSLCCQHFFHVVLFEMFLIVSRGRGARPQAAHSRREPPPRAPGRSLQNAGASAGQGGAGRGAGRSQRRGGALPEICGARPAGAEARGAERGARGGGSRRRPCA